MRKRLLLALAPCFMLVVLIGFGANYVIASPGSSWSIQTVDNEGDVGRYTSMALDENGNPHISYFDSTNINLKYARWTGSTWSIQTVDNADIQVGEYPSIALDENGNPHISYYDITNTNLKYARWTGSTWSIQTVDNAGIVGEYTSIALDENGNPHISYYDWTNRDLKYAYWTGENWDIQTVDSAGFVGWYTSIAVDSHGYPHISYYDWTNNDLKYAHWDGSAWNISVVDSTDAVGEYTSIALDNSDYPHISYLDATNGDLKYAYWTGDGWDISTVDRTGAVGWFTSIALDSSGNPHISYCDWTNNDLKYARWTGSRWAISTVDSTGDVGWYTSIAFDNRGYPHISYYDSTNRDLKYARTSPPVLSSGSVSPSSGPWGTTFTYEVTYTDAEGDAPNYVRVYVDGTAHAMTLENGDYENGALYRYTWVSESTDIGSHTYYFETSDGISTVRDPTTGTYSGPTVAKKSTSLTCSVDNSAPLKEQEIRFSGNLRDQDNTGLSGKTVYLYVDGSSTGLTAITDDNGRYNIFTTAMSTAGNYNYTVKFAGDALYSSCESPPVSVTVGVRTYRVFGYVRCEDIAVENAQVTLDGQSTTTDENGYYEFTGVVGDNSYTIEVSAEGYQTYTGTVSVGSADERFDVNLVKVVTEPNAWQIPVAIVVIIVVVSSEVIIITRARKRAQM